MLIAYVHTSLEKPARARSCPRDRRVSRWANSSRTNGCACLPSSAIMVSKRPARRVAPFSTARRRREAKGRRRFSETFARARRVCTFTSPNRPTNTCTPGRYVSNGKTVVKRHPHFRVSFPHPRYFPAIPCFPPPKAPEFRGPVGVESGKTLAKLRGLLLS